MDEVLQSVVHHSYEPNWEYPFRAAISECGDGTARVMELVDQAAAGPIREGIQPIIGLLQAVLHQRHECGNGHTARTEVSRSILELVFDCSDTSHVAENAVLKSVVTLWNAGEFMEARDAIDKACALFASTSFRDKLLMALCRALADGDGQHHQNMRLFRLAQELRDGPMAGPLLVGFIRCLTGYFDNSSINIPNASSVRVASWLIQRVSPVPKDAIDALLQAHCVRNEVRHRSLHHYDYSILIIIVDDFYR